MNVWPPTSATFWQGSGWLVLTSPMPSNAAADTMLNAIPGCSLAASGPSGGSGTLPA